MSNYVPPADKSEGEILYAIEDWNPFKNGLAAFLNNGNLGNSNFSSNPSEALVEAKLALDAPTGAHKSRHEPSGADEVQEIDILGSGDLLSAHASRHADGGADPMPAKSISSEMLADFAVADRSLTKGITGTTHLAGQADLTYVDRGQIDWDFANDPPSDLNTANPMGSGVVVNGFLYVCLENNESVLKLDLSKEHDDSSAWFTISMGGGTAPNSLYRDGDLIYVLCGGTFEIKTFDHTDADPFSTLAIVVDLHVDGPAANPNIIAASGMIRNSDGTVAYIVIYVSGDSAYRYVIRVLYGTGVTHLVDMIAQTGRALTQLAYSGDVVNGDSIIVARDHSTTPQILKRSGLDLSSEATHTITGAVGMAALAEDDENIYYANSGASDPIVLDKKNFRLVQLPDPQFDVAKYPGSYIPWGLPRMTFFDGRNLWLPWSDGGGSPPYALKIPNKQYNDAYSIQPIGQTASMQLNGFATDGEYVYIYGASATVTASYIVRVPLV